MKFLVVISVLALVAAVGLLLMGPDPSSLASDGSEGDPIAWCSSGGGWRAMTAGMGVARALKQAGVLDHPELKYAGSNSGGSWFLGQFAYSSKFHASVTGDAPMAEVVYDWMMREAPILRNASRAELEDWIQDPIIVAVLSKLMGALKALFLLPRSILVHFFGTATVTALDGLLGDLEVAVGFEGSWGLYIDTMFAVADPALERKQAVAKDRLPTSIPRAALHFQMANLTDFTNDGPLNSWMIDSGGKAPEAHTLPMQWVVPALADEPLDSTARWAVPLPVREAGVRVATRLDGLIPPAFDTQPAMFPLGTYVGQDVPRLSQIVGFSSAFAALLGSSNMTTALVLELEKLAAHKGKPGELPPGTDAPGAADMLKKVIKEVKGLAKFAANGKDSVSPRCQKALDRCAALDPTDWFVVLELPFCLMTLAFECHLEPLKFVADLAPCAAPGPAVRFSERHCAYPHVRLADGAYVDNTAVAQTIGLMQADKRNAGKTLRLIVVGNAQTTDSGKPDRSSINNLFAHPDVEPGRTTFSTGLGSPSPQVFASAAVDIPWAKVEPTLYTYSARVRTKTVDNVVYSVKGGQAVDVLILSVEGPISPSIGFHLDPEEYRKLGAFAADATNANVVAKIEEWLQASGA